MNRWTAWLVFGNWLSKNHPGIAGIFLIVFYGLLILIAAAFVLYILLGVIVAAGVLIYNGLARIFHFRRCELLDEEKVTNNDWAWDGTNYWVSGVKVSKDHFVKIVGKDPSQPEN